MNLLSTFTGSMMEGFLPRGWDLAKIDRCCSQPTGFDRRTPALVASGISAGRVRVGRRFRRDDGPRNRDGDPAIARRRRKPALILPVGPMGMYRWAVYFLKQWSISCDHVFGFNMDEWSDRDGRTLAPENPGSFQHAMQAAFYGPLGSLTVAEKNRWFATADRLPHYAERIGELRASGARLSVIFGIGRVCHIAFWEPHFAEEFVGLDDWKAQTHRLGARLHPLTIEQNAITSFKSRTTLVPAFANTIGPGLFLKADHIIGGAEGVFDRGMQWQGSSLWMTLRYGPDPWVPSSFMPTLPGRLFYHRELAGPLEPEMN